MARKPRWQQRATAVSYHVMNRGHNREVVFATDADSTYFLGLLERYRQRFAVRLHHYCLMGNHFHLLVRCDDPAELSPWMAGLLRALRPLLPPADGLRGAPGARALQEPGGGGGGVLP